MNKVVLITGASRGIGRDIAEKLAQKGYQVIANYNRSEEKAKELKSKYANILNITSLAVSLYILLCFLLYAFSALSSCFIFSDIFAISYHLLHNTLATNQLGYCVRREQQDYTDYGLRHTYNS